MTNQNDRPVPGDEVELPETIEVPREMLEEFYGKERLAELERRNAKAKRAK